MAMCVSAGYTLTEWQATGWILGLFAAGWLGALICHRNDIFR